MKKVFFIILLGILLALPVAASAAWHSDPYKAKDEDGNIKNIGYEGLVPCGKKVCVGVRLDLKGNVLLETTDAEGKPAPRCPSDAADPPTVACSDAACPEYKEIHCQFCHFFLMLTGILNFLLINVVFPIAVLLLVIGGAMFIFSAGSPTTLAKGKSIMTSVVWGLVIIFASWIVVNMIFIAMGVKKWTGLLPETGSITYAGVTHSPSGDDYWIVDDDKNWEVPPGTTGELTGLPLAITDKGTGIEKSYIIKYNLQHSIVIEGSFDPMPEAGSKYKIGGWFQIKCPIELPSP